MPLLALLYNSSSRSTNQMYMLLVVILIMSQDAALGKNIHSIVLPSLPFQVRPFLHLVPEKP